MRRKGNWCPWNDGHGPLLMMRHLGGQNGVEVKLKPRTNYTPGSFPYETKVKIHEGSGVFKSGDLSFAYGPNESEIIVPADKLHCFLRVDTETRFIRSYPENFGRSV